MAGGQGLFRVKIGVYRSCQGALWHDGAWKPCYCLAGLKIEALWHSVAWNPRYCVAGLKIAALGYAIA